MTVRASKVAINVREALNALKKKTGLFGERIMRAETVTDFYNVIGTNRNLMINGSFRVSQRGDFTTLGALTSNGYSRVDRWYTNSASNTASLQHKLNQTLPNGDVTNTIYQVQTATGYTSLGQHIEDYQHLLGKTVTFSFWAKANINAAFSYYDGLAQPFGIFLIPDGQWRYYTWTTKLPTAMTQLRPELWSNTASAPVGSYFEVAQMQLEIGSVATPFEHKTYASEFALCQRYLQVIRSTDISYSWLVGHVTTGNTAIPIYNYPVEMRVAPTVSLSGGDLTVYSGLVSLGFSSATVQAGKKALRYLLIVPAATIGDACHVDITTNGVVTLSAEM